MEKKNGFYLQELSFNHIQSMSSWTEKRSRDNNQSTVSELLSTKILQKRRFYMTSVIEVIYFLIENELPF